MIYHLVLFKFRRNCTSEEYANLQTAVTTLAGIKGVLSARLDAINNSVYAGYDDRTKGYTHTLMVLLKDKNALEHYDKDSTHGLIKTGVIKPMLDLAANDPVLAVDWEADAPSWKQCPLSQLKTWTGVGLITVSLLAAAGFTVMRSRL